jgi:tetratricopeptide (TPR) repeat protein
MLKIVILLFVLTAGLRAEEASLMFEQANQFYRSNDYQKAASLYEQVVKNGYESPYVFFNLGNAYFKLQNIPAAILNYERAHRLAPHDEDISYNLRLANLRIVDRIEPVPELFIIAWWKSCVNFLSSGGWATVSIIALWCIVAGIAILLMSRLLMLQRIALFTALLAFLIAIVGFIATYQRLRIERDSQSAILFIASVSVKSAPDEQSTDLFVLHEGVKVEFLDSVGEWRKIRLLDGKVGWLHSSAAQVI